MKIFSKNNSGFVCENCGFLVLPHPSSSRDHCTECLWGKHVDINPGDRQNTCKALLEPIGLKIANGKSKIVYRCTKCSEVVQCITALDDNKEQIIKLSKKVF